MLAVRFAALLVCLASAAHAKLHVRVLDPAGRAIPGAYVGVVIKDTPWKLPLAETIVAGDEAATFDIAPGLYQLVAGAPGFDTQFRTDVDLRGDEQRLDIRLERLGVASGRIVDSDGKPVARARMGMFWEFLDEHPRVLSEKATALLRGNTIVESDADGLFELLLPSRGPAVVIVEAEGMAPLAIENVSTGSTALSNVTLTRGASLSVTWSGQQAANAADRLDLVPISTELSPTIPRPRATRMWRRFAGDGRWRGLPAGTYDVVLRRGGADTAMVLDRVTLRAGDRISRQLEYPQPAPAGEHEIVLRSTAEAKKSAVEVTRWRGNRQQRLDARSTNVEAGVRLVVRGGDCVDRDRLLVTDDRRIASISIDDCDRWPSESAFFPRANVRLDFTPSGRIAVGGELDLTTSESGQTVTIPFDLQGGIATVPAIAECAHALVRVPGFMPVTLGTLRVAAGHTEELPPVRLMPAGTLQVRLLDKDALPVRGARGALVTADVLKDVRDLKALSSLDTDTPKISDAEGWIRLSVPPGKWHQLLILRDTSPLPHLTQPFVLDTGEERVEQVTLDEPGQLSLSIQRDDTTANVHAAAAMLRPAETSPWPPSLELRASFGPDGSALFETVPPGAWTASVLARLEGGTIVPVGREAAEVLPRARASSSIRLSDLIYRGRVEIGGQPVDGIISFQSDGKAPSQVATIANGAFAVLLERPGTFGASVQRTDGARLPVLQPVAFRSPREEVHVRLGASVVAGRVVNERGDPVPDVRVTMVSTSDGSVEAQAFSAADGSFEVRALSAGRWQLRAGATGRRSQTQFVEIKDDEIRRGLELRLMQLKAVRGTVRNAAGAVIRDAIVIIADGAHPERPPLTAVTNDRGEFQIEIPVADASPANVVVTPIDKAWLHAARVELRDGMTIVTAPLFGSVTLQGPFTPAAAGAHAIVGEDGAWFHPLTAGLLAGGTIVLKAIPAGNWRYVVADQPALRDLVRLGKGNLITPAATFVSDPQRPAEVVVRIPR